MGLTWAFHADYTGYKVVKAIVSNPVAYTNTVVKYDGKILTRLGSSDSWTGSDQSQLYTDNYIYISIADTDSGWGETYTPSSAEISAFISFGWKLNNGTFGTNYNGTGTKTWIPWNATDNTNAVTTVPTTIASGFPQYSLSYQKSVTEDVPVTVEGALSLRSGLNTVELGEGVIVREVANLYYSNSSGQGRYYINGQSAHHMKYRVKKILKIYDKNGNDDTPNWTIASITDASNTAVMGLEGANILAANYDPTASYPVTYLPLDEYLLTPNIVSAIGTYNTNLSTVVGQNVQDITDAKTRISVIQNTYARKQQGQWITPTLLNSWVSSTLAGYFMDEFGFVHLKGVIRDGTVAQGTVLFVLPFGYRPKLQSIYLPTCTTSSALAVTPQTVTVGTSGTVTIADKDASTYITLDGLIFRAEQ